MTQDQEAIARSNEYREHSTSDSTSLPALPTGWAWGTVEQLASPEPNAITDGPFGSNLKTAHYTSTGPRVIRLQNIGDGMFIDARAYISQAHYESLAKHRVEEGDVVIAALGESLPRACVIPASVGPAIVKADCIRFQPDRRLASAKFLNFALNAEQTRARTASIVHGVGRPRLNLSEIKSIVLPLAPLSEQRRIVAEIEKQFTRLDAAVAALKRVQANLKRYRASVLKAACEGRLVPTEAELAHAEGRDCEPADRLLARILEERRAKWEADQFIRIQGAGKAATDDRWKAGYREPVAPNTGDRSELPEGWAWASVEQLSHIQGGIQKQPKRAPVRHAFPFLRVANVLRGRLDLREVHKIELFGDELVKLRLEDGDLLVVEGNGSPSEIGRMAVWMGAIEDCVHQNHIIRVRPVAGVQARYIETYWNSPAGAHAVMRVASSTSGLYTLSVAKVSRLLVPLPPLAEQHRIIAEVERHLSQIDELEAVVAINLKRAARLRQAILRRAFEGRLVPQDPSDEPAPVLLERIRAEQEAAVVGEQTGRGRRVAAKRKAARTVANSLPLFNAV